LIKRVICCAAPRYIDVGVISYVSRKYQPSCATRLYPRHVPRDRSILDSLDVIAFIIVPTISRFLDPSIRIVELRAGSRSHLGVLRRVMFSEREISKPDRERERERERFRRIKIPNSQPSWSGMEIGSSFLIAPSYRLCLQSISICFRASRIRCCSICPRSGFEILSQSNKVTVSVKLLV